MRTVSRLLLVACILSPALAVAQDHQHETRYSRADGELIVRWGGTGYQPSGPAPDFARLDTNADGHVTTDEARGYALLANDFIRADTNRDGRISAAEYERWNSLP